MNRLRLPFALLFQILLLQVTVLGGGMACAPAWLQSVAAAHAASGHDAHDMHGMHDAHAPSTPEGVEHGPAQQQHGSMPSHCATTGCVAIAVRAPEMTVAPVAIVATSVAAIRVSAPHWMHLAPEPPPPRA